MSERVEQINKSQLIDLVRSERQHLEDTLAQLNEDQFTQPGIKGEWSVKDILAHITAWQKRMMTWMSETLRGEIPEMPAPGMTWNDLDRLNQQTYQADRKKPLAQVIADFTHSYQEALKMLEITAEEDLIDPERFGWRAGSPLWKMVAANTCWHYKMHNESIRSWLAKLKEV